MAETALNVFKIILKSSFFLSAILAMFAMLTYAIGLIGVTLNQSVLADLLALIQLWLPFNLYPLIGWFVFATIGWIYVRLCLYALSMVNNFLNS